MSKRQLLCLLGVWVTILPFLGFPSPSREIIPAISGIAIVIIAYNLRHQSRSNTADPGHAPTFTENNNHHSQI